jgi:membrane protease YdiL (CAAX protease family)
LGLLSAGSDARGPALPANFRGLLIATSLGLVSFLAVFAIGWLASRASRDQLLLHWRPGWLVLPLGIGYSVAIRFVAGLGLGLVFAALVITRIIPPDEVQKFASENRPQIETLVDLEALTKDPVYFWFTITVVSFVVAGLREELWRSAFLAGMGALWPGAFGSKSGQVLAAAVGAVVFGLGHLPMGILAVIMTGVLGFCLGLIMIFHRSIWPAVMAHGFFDATTFAILPWVKDLLETTQKTLGH